MIREGEMLRKQLIAALFSFSFLVGTVSAEQLFVLKIGPAWPVALLKSDKATAWDASMLGGLAIDRKVSVGGGVDFLWNVNSREEHVTGNIYRRETTEKTFMIPVSGYVSVDPVPDLIVHPCITAQVGVNTMYFSHAEDSIAESGSASSLIDENGWYFGFYWKIAADAVYDLSEKSGVFAGIDYQWSQPRKIDINSSDLYTKRNMGAVGIRMGLRMIF
jgi:hypothetical protein